MKKSLLVCVSLFAFTLGYSEVLLSENFEKSETPEIDKMWRPDYSQVMRVEKKAISGKASLMLDCTRNTKHDFPKHIRLFNNNLPNNSLITISFKFKVIL